jgi:hypothetical protein
MMMIIMIMMMMIIIIMRLLRLELVAVQLMCLSVFPLHLRADRCVCISAQMHLNSMLTECGGGVDSAGALH